MNTDQVIEVLSFANGNQELVRLILRDKSEVVGVPSSVDLHPTAHEVFLRPHGADDTEIGISISAILSAELV